MPRKETRRWAPFCFSCGNARARRLKSRAVETVEMGRGQVNRLFRACIMGVLLGTTPLSAHASEYLLTSQVLRVYPQSADTIILSFATDAAQCTSPATPKQQYIAVGQNGATADCLRTMQATAMTALSTGISPKVAFGDVTINCHVSQAHIEKWDRLTAD